MTDDNAKYLGRPRRRLEDRRFVTGKGRFVSDFATPRTLHATFTRSVVPHGRIVSVDLGNAREMPGVVAVMTAVDLELSDIKPLRGVSEVGAAMARPPLARERVRYVGEPVAVVVAETRAAGLDAAEQVWPEIEELPAVVEPRAAAGSEPLFPVGNVAYHSVFESGDRATDDFPVTAAVEVENQRLAPSPIEGLAILCEPEDGALKITCSHQAPHRLRDQLESILRIEGIRVVVPDVGGAFGLKGMFFPEYLVTAAVARSLDRPVMWVERRREHFISGTHGRGQSNRVELAGDEAGRIRRARIEILGDAGAYPHNGALIPTLSHLTASGLYDIEDVSVEITTVVTNRAPTGSYRGAGRPEAAFSIERAVDAFARAAGLDPAVVRARNFISKDQLPYEAPSGVLYDSGDYAAALARALELVGESDVRREQRDRLERGADPIGLGIGAFIERAGGPVDSGEYAKVSLLESGSISVRTGSTSSGQGHETVWAQALADVFSVDLTQVEVIAGDTAEVSEGFGTFGSRSAQAGASAAWRMAVKVRDKARETAAEMLEAAPTDLVLANGRFSVSGVPGSDVALAEVAAYAQDNEIDLSSDEMFVPGKQTFPYGAHVAVVEVELETGAPNLLRFVAVDDCGNVLNPMIVEGQVHGSLTQGLGQALLEGIEYSQDGQLSTASFLDYKLPAATDVPRFDTDRLVSPAPSNPLGVKGTGEAGCIGAPPAVVNAVLDALAPFGVTDVAMPLRPNRIWEAIQRARKT